MRTLRPWAQRAFVSIVLGGAALQAQVVSNRITAEIDSRSMASLPGSKNPLAVPPNDTGRVEPGTRLTGLTVYFKQTAAQKAELDALVKVQQTPGSTSYHKWLTPEEYASRFGVSDADLTKIEDWLQQQGFFVDRVAQSRTSITFSGSVGQVESTFQTEVHHYKIGGETHFAPATEISIPSALSDVVQSVRNLDDFRPKPLVRFRPAAKNVPNPAFTSSQSGSHYLQPGDIAVIYDIKAAYSAGYTGTGQSIAVVGQSEIDVSDVEHFQSAAGLTVKDPTLVLVPDSGSAAVSSGDEAESDIDLEYSSGIAKGATIYFVYVGNNTNYSVWDSIQYAVDTNVAPIISVSYGACEADLSSSDYTTLESILEQGASQGQSILVASGDAGSTACYADVTSSTTTITSQETALAVSYPASSAYVTGLGGTEFPSADVSSSNTNYWESTSGSDVVTSAKSYIPEQVWNDDSASTASQDGAAYALSSGGGGTSTLTARPSWQSGVPGISSGSYRLVPDIALDSSPNNAGYLFCSGDSTSTGITGSCSNGFRDSSNEYLTVAGGTSFAAPIFAGMLAIISQKENATGQGLINSTLYTMAANASTYASAFHDITNGGNECTAGSTYCSSAGESKYYATTGYDEASGLGSVDLYNLMTSWTGGTSSSTLEATITALSAASNTPSAGASDIMTITVSPQSSVISTSPTGTLTIAVDGTTETSSLALSNGSATYTFSSSTSGAHVVTVKYSGDSTFAPSSGAITVNVGGTSGTSSGGTFALSATNVTVSQGGSGASTITVTSKSSYAGTVGFAVSSSSSSLSTYGCYDINDVSVAANGTATTTLTLYTSSSVCNTTSSSRKGMHHTFVHSGKSAGIAPRETPSSPTPRPFTVALMAGLLCLALPKRRSRLWTVAGSLLLIVAMCFLSACGSSSNSNDVAKGSYTVELDGTDTSNSSIASSTTFTLTVD